ncbi:FxSxx-COOH system tetratricopeptide repeat protein [Catenulispora subtropica]|uniref:FxSxx-COOH system tetratricopeptide repeat protein n=1 Tax=Catenulispora subtropica TaxID=450798 RepID=A0ABP5EEP2_9ACTN
MGTPMPEPTEPAAPIFVNFRNGDDPYAAWTVQRMLGDRFGPRAVFRSSESIPPGADWEATIWHHHRGCAVFLAVIGPRWLTIADDRGRRLHQPGDWVREEIAEALRAKKLVIPLLVSGAARPTAKDLPEDLVEMVRLQTVAMDHRGRTTDLAIDALVRRIEPVVRPMVGAVPEPGVGAGAAPSARSAAPRGLPPGPPPRNIPPVGPHHLARPEAVSAVDDAVRAVRASGRSGPVVVWGEIGTGKTRLAAEYAGSREAEHAVAWWIAADRPDLVPSQLATLAQALGLDLGEMPDTGAVVPALVRALRARGRWLLVFDGVPGPDDLVPYLALADGGDVVVTSRTGAWGELAAGTCRVGRFSRETSVRLLGARLGPAADTVLDDLAAALDDLPAAVGQAAAFLAAAPLGPARYAELLAGRTAEILARNVTHSYPASLAAAWSLALDRLAADTPAAEELVRHLAVLAAAPVPFEFFEAGAGAAAGPPALVAAGADPLRLLDLGTAVARTGLFPVDAGAFHPFPLFQAFIRSQTDGGLLAAAAADARRWLAAVPREDPREPAAWRTYRLLLPHVLALASSGFEDVAGDPGWRALSLDVMEYLVVHADAGTARDLAQSAVEHWAAGPEAAAATERLAQAWYRLGDHRRAAGLDVSVLEERRRSDGADAPRTLRAEHNLAIDRWAAAQADGDRAAATALLEDVVRRRTRILGDHHPDTLRSVHNLALARRAAGAFAEALELDETCRTHFAEALGPDHPDTLRSALAAALDLRALARHPEALKLEEETHDRLNRTLGPDHPDTLRSAYGLAVSLHHTGDTDRAREFAEAAHAGRRKILGDEHPDTLRTVLLLSQLRVECGDAGGVLP